MAGTVGGVRSGNGSGSGSGMYAQLLLLAALLFGIITMHTVGHPAEHAEREAAAPPVSVAMATPVSVGVGAPPVPADAVIMPVADAASAGPPAPASAGPVASDVGHPSHRSSDDTPMSGMDPLSVCLAVLGAWGLALLGAWLSGLRADGRPLGTAVGAGLLRVLRPDPPPPIPVLAGVSVLRI